nr:MAG TPA: virion morphogenesis protein [Caudoviricetes sp.]
MGVDMATVSTVRLNTKGLDAIIDSFNGKPVSRVLVGIGSNHKDVQEYATYVEYGWVQRVTEKQQWWFRGQGIKDPPKAGAALVSQPRPFLRGTLMAEASNWAKGFAASLRESRDIHRSLVELGTQAMQDVQDTIRRGGTRNGQFPERKNLTMELYAADAARHKVSKGASAISNSSTRQPLTLSGALQNSIAFQVD